ncbi:hemocyanin AA6 chain-like [Asterias amurensis]|uniref:hemocyanin AA6 chain-like n=1 Tax=Asterias amurensis TaxID=7602 RepID=UPI003AB72E2B
MTAGPRGVFSVCVWLCLGSASFDVQASMSCSRACVTDVIIDSDQAVVLSLFSAVDDLPAHYSSYGGYGDGEPLVGYAFVPSHNITESDIFPNGIGVLPQGHQFSIFKKSHAEEAARIVNYLVSLPTLKKFKEDADRLRAILNEGIYLYATSTAVLHREDTHGVLLPPLWQINSRHYFPGPVIKRAFDLARRGKVGGSDVPALPLPTFTTGTHRDPEFKLAWWREDCGFNVHHYHWHQVNPYRGVNGLTKDRQGELFYYMHHQMLARYDAERMAVGLSRVEPYINWHLPIPEGYNSHLTDHYGDYQFAARPAGMTLVDNVRDPSEPVLVMQQEYHRNQLLDAIITGKFEKPDGTKVDVDIDGLGAAIESSVSSPNSDLYGSVHNLGHDILAGITDPDLRYKQAGGVMGDNSAAARDPIFFRWHKFLDNLFVMHKIKLVPYNKTELGFQNVQVDSVELQMVNPDQPVGPNILITQMDTVAVDISHDMFMNKQDKIKLKTAVNVNVTQVNHKPFHYKVGVTNKSGKPVKAAIRIFMAPSIDEQGTQLDLDTQRRIFIEMDKFVTTLPTGSETIERSSTCSSVIRPRELSIDELKAKGGSGGPTKKQKTDRYCECGWPQNMLVPRGTAAGMPFDLFVMVTNWAKDSSTDYLDRGTSYCGVKNKSYPDKRAMGFPFDRKIDSKTYKRVADFANGFPNMMTVPVKITRV